MSKYRIRVHHFLRKSWFSKKLTPDTNYIVEVRKGGGIYVPSRALGHAVFGSKPEAVYHLNKLVILENRRGKLPRDEFIYP